MDVILNAQRDVNEKFGPEFKPLEKETIYKRSYIYIYMTFYKLFLFLMV